MFNNSEETLKAREESANDYEAHRSKREADQALSNQIERKYSEMISNLQSGRVDPKTYIQDEMIHLSSEDMANLRESNAMAKLHEKKYQLNKAREEAEINWRKKEVLEKLTGKEIDNINRDEIENSLSPEQFNEYRQRLYQKYTEQQETPEQPDNTEYQI